MFPGEKQHIVMWSMTFSVTLRAPCGEPWSFSSREAVLSDRPGCGLRTVRSVRSVRTVRSGGRWWREAVPPLALTKGQECLSFPLSTTPLFICFLIGAKSVKCCWTELEVICSSSCLPELGDKVVFKRVCMFSHMSVVGPYIGNLKKDQLNVSWCKPLSTWASLHILHAGC